jgi:hypothetical protein
MRTNLKEIRAQLRDRYGARNYRIAVSGTIQARGPGLPWRNVGSLGPDGLTLAGRRADLEAGARHTVYLDAASIKRASILGDGNISLGIRRALEIAVL